MFAYFSSILATYRRELKMRYSGSGHHCLFFYSVIGTDAVLALFIKFHHKKPIKLLPPKIKLQKITALNEEHIF